MKGLSNIFFSVLVFCLVFLPSYVFASSFERNLSLGMRGDDVKSLQILLNSDKDTQVAESGIGSSGLESGYFGEMTRRAVIKFQEKYASAILTPSGLSSGTGFVGAKTRAFMTSFAGANVSSSVAQQVQTAPTYPSQATTPLATPPKTNPNQQNLSLFVEKVKEIGQKKGISSENIALVSNQIVKDSASTTDFRQEFLKNVKTKNSASNLFMDALADLFLPKVANAILERSFGGQLLYAYPCYCSMSWMLYITPLPPDYVVLLNYTMFSQAYSGYNIPFTTQILGLYEPTGGICSIYVPPYSCVTYPTEGDITPTVGSSGI